MSRLPVHRASSLDSPPVFILPVTSIRDPKGSLPKIVCDMNGNLLTVQAPSDHLCLRQPEPLTQHHRCLGQGGDLHLRRQRQPCSTAHPQGRRQRWTRLVGQSRPFLQWHLACCCLRGREPCRQMITMHLVWRLTVKCPVQSRLIVEQPVIWVGWTRNYSANSASGLSPLSAARTTYALHVAP